MTRGHESVARAFLSKEVVGWRQLTSGVRWAIVGPWLVLTLNLIVLAVSRV